MAKQQPGRRPARPKTASARSGGALTTRRGGPKPGPGEQAGVPPIGHNSYRPPSGKDSELFVKYAKLAEAQDKAVERANSALQSEKQNLGQIYREAKEAGIPAARVAMLKKTIKERKKDAGEILTDERERAWQHVVLKSKVAEVVPMFKQLTAEPSLTEIEIMGERAGANNEPPDNNPFTPGTKQGASWENGRVRGQKKAAKEVFNKDADKGQGDGTGTATAAPSNVHRLN